MGKKRKRDDNVRSNASRKNNIIRREHSQNTSRAVQNGRNQKARPTAPTVPVKIKVPFSRFDRVLLVGEGDFSFAASLTTNHDVGAVTATSFDALDELKAKYSDIETALKQLGAGPETDTSPTEDDEAWAGFSDTGDSGDGVQDLSPGKVRPKISVLHGIDATKLSTSHRNLLKAHSPFSKIVFNFPHVGGLSTDVNRQVRANQQLLVNFFNSAKPLLATTTKPAEPFLHTGVDVEYDSNGEEVTQEPLSAGRILVTLFEGEPYTLWNIRDLARHCGLQVVESFRFPWSAYPGYTHARTLGDITAAKDRNDGKRKSAWRGEERDARTYILAPKEDVLAMAQGGRKRKQYDSDDGE